MTPRLRAVLGATAGAILVLTAHPATRPSVTAAFRPSPPQGVSGFLARPALHPPTSLDAAAAFLHAGAERLQADRTLSESERRTLIALATQGEARESDNPFWPLALSVLHGGTDRPARDAWRRASRCKRYYDHQRPLLIADREQLAAKVGKVQGWMYAAIATERSDAMVQLFRRMAIRVMQRMRSPEERLEFAYETIRNGALVRDGSERLSLGQVGIEMIEAAPYPASVLPAGKKSPIARLYIAKTSFTATLRAAGRVADAAYCDRQFRTNDSWEAFRSVESPQERFDALAVAAVYAATLPGALLVSAFVGGVILLLGRRIGRIAYASHRFHGSGLAAASLTSLLAGAVLGTPLVGLAAGACALVPALSPHRPKRFGGETLGPLHVLVVGTMSVVVIVSLVVAAVARTLSGTLLSQFGPFGALLGDGRRWMSLALVTFGASALAPPAWAYVRRYSTPAVAARTYRDMGRLILYVSLALAILACPLALAADRWLGGSLAEIALNEQNAYRPLGRERG